MVEGSLEVKLPTVWTDGKADRWESRGGKSQRREEKRREDQRRESQKKEGKPRNIVFFQWFVAPEGRKVGSPKQRVRSHLARWEMKNCTRCGTKHMWKSKCRKHLTFGPLLEVEMSKKCTPVWREAHFQVKMYKARHSQSTFGSWHVEKVHAIVARSTCPSQKVKNTTCSDHFWTFRCRLRGSRKGPCQKWAESEGFVAVPKALAAVAHFKRVCKDTFSVTGAVQETCPSEMLGGPGGDFLRGVVFWSIKSSVLGKWFCVTGAALPMTWPHFFVAGAAL